MGSRKGLLTAFLIAGIITMISSCAKKPKSEMVVATINDYQMTVDDFNFESKHILRMGRFVGDIPVTKEAVLDALIVKELLLQEAQHKDLDKDRDFLRAIELYWEQTLIKSLFSRKAEDSRQRITVFEEEITEHYEKMRNRIRAKVLIFDGEEEAKRVLAYAGDPAEYLQAHADKTPPLYIIPSKLYELGQDDTALEAAIFGLDAAATKDIIKVEDNWAVIYIEERTPNDPGPLPEARDEIIKVIEAHKQKELMDEWMEELRSKARIKVNRKLLSEL